MPAQTIPTIEPEIRARLAHARSVIEQFVPDLCAFQLKRSAENINDHYVVPLSGGSDSTGMAILLRCLFPDTPFVFVFCDTKAESEDLYLNLRKLEAWAGISIIHIDPPMGLLEYIDHYGGFLPNAQSRWCTRLTKIEPLDNWLAAHFDLGGKDRVWTHVGIRADEDRFGYVSSETDSVQMVLPYVKLGINREAVYTILSETIGIANNYRWNSRSSCYCCFFKRRSEKIGLLLNRPDEFNKAAALEKLTAEDAKRFEFTQLTEALSVIPLNHHDYLIPSVIDLRTQHQPTSPRPVRHKRDTLTADLFDDCYLSSDSDEEIFVAVAFWVNSLLPLYCGHGGPGVWWQELITYSPTLAGLKKALLFHWEHKLGTPELYGIDQSTLREELKIALIQIKVPKGVIDMSRVSDGSYTWGTDEAYAQIKHHTKLISSILKLESLRKQHAEYEAMKHHPEFELTWEYEELERVNHQLEETMKADIGGYVAWSGVFNPPTDDELPSRINALRKLAQSDADVQAETGTTCIACSL